MGCHTWFYRNIEYLNKQLDCEFHDVFRIGGYPETILTSLDEALLFIENNNCQTYANTIDKLKEFFDKYPNGVIEFG